VRRAREPCRGRADSNRRDFGRLRLVSPWHLPDDAQHDKLPHDETLRHPGYSVRGIGAARSPWATNGAMPGLTGRLRAMEFLMSIQSVSLILLVVGIGLGLGFSLLVVATMHMMGEVFAGHSRAAESLRAVSANAHDAIIVMNHSGTIVSWNPAAQRIFGYGEHEARGKKLSELIVPERCRIEFENMFNRFGGDARGSGGSTPTELAGVRKDGTEIVTEYSISWVVVDGRSQAIYIVRDISARSRAEQKIRERAAALERLSAKMLSDDEMDKQKLAFGLREGLAQTLVTIKLHIERRLTQFGASTARDRRATDESLASIVLLLQTAIEDVRTIASGLRPSSLDELGLLPTIKSFCREFDRLHPAIGVSEEISVRENDVPAPLKIVVYRVIESAFTTIARYEGSDQIALSFELSDGAIALAIAYTPHDSRRAENRNRDADLQQRFVEAHERTALSGGNFTTERGTSGGIMLRASWPSMDAEPAPRSVVHAKRGIVRASRASRRTGTTYS
jgi:PAS domain S-box-containing protein